MDDLRPGDVGYGAVRNFSPDSRRLETPSALAKLIEMSRLRAPQLSGGISEAATLSTQDLNGLTPLARKALEAILIRNTQGSGMADIGARARVDSQYGPQSLM